MSRSLGWCAVLGTVGLAVVAACGSSTSSNSCNLTVGPEPEDAGSTVRYLYGQSGDGHISTLSYTNASGGTTQLSNPVTVTDSTYEIDVFFASAGQATLNATGTYGSGHWNISIVDQNGQTAAACPG